MTYTSSFSVNTVIPLVKRIIREIFADTEDLVRHRQICERLLADPAGQRLAIKAFEQQTKPRSVEHVASNMVAWFSAQYRIRKGELSAEFERERVDGRFAYRPIAPRCLLT